MALFCECSRTTQEALRGRFIQTLTEKSIANQNMRVQGYDRATKDDTGSKELVDLRNRNTFLLYFIMVLINVFMSVWYFCKRKLEEKCLFILLYITRLRGITSTIAIVIGLCVVYTVVYTGDKNKSVVQKKMKFFLFCFKVLTVS